MLSWLKKKDWRGSKAHLLLLSNFRICNSAATYNDAHYWESALGEKPSVAIEHFLKEGMLGLAGLLDLVDYKFKASELKVILKERGLKVSGRKEELVQRIVDNAPAEMHKATRELVMYSCTEEGLQIANSYLEEEKAKKLRAEQESLNLLKMREYSKAVQIVAKYESSQVFPRGLGIDWDHYDSTADIGMLNIIFNATPEILRGMDENRLSHIRLTAGMAQLWGTNTGRPWLPENFESQDHLRGDIASEMLVDYASHLRSMQGYREVGVKTVEILGARDENVCSECRKIIGKKFKLDNVPELPYARCTSKFGCRCTTAAGEF